MCCPAFRLTGKVAVDGLHLVKVAQLHRYAGQKFVQPSVSVAGNALDNRAFCLYLRQGSKVKGVAFIRDFADEQRLFAHGIEQHHDAVIVPEISGVEDEVGGFWGGKF